MSYSRVRFDAKTLGTNLCIHQWNESAKHTIVLVHGFLDSGIGFRTLIEESLAPHFRVIAPDMRGHGFSSHLESGYYHFMDYVADLADIMDWVGSETIALIGHSMGGSIASYYAAAFPEKVERLVLMEGLGPTQSDSISLPDRTRRWVSGVRRAKERRPRVYESVELAAKALMKHDKFLTLEMAKILAKDCTELFDQGFRFPHDNLHLSRGPLPYQEELALQFWKEITAKTLLISAQQSEFKNEAYQRRIASFPNATEITIASAGHMMHRHQPLEIGRVLKEFLLP